MQSNGHIKSYARVTVVTTTAEADIAATGVTAASVAVAI